jgi:hypothetical protein
MGKNIILTEINRMKELMGLNLLMEGDGFIGVLEKIVDKLGATSEKDFDRGILKQSETLFRRNIPKFVEELETIGQKFEKGSEIEAEQLLDKFISNENNFEQLLSIIKSSNKKAYLEIIDDQFMKKFGKETYDNLSRFYYNVPENQRSWAMKQVLKKSGIEINTVTGERIIKDWVPNPVKEKTPPKLKPHTNQKSEVNIKTSTSLSPSETISKPKLAISGSGVKGEPGEANLYNQNATGKISGENVVNDKRNVLGYWKSGFKVEPKLDELGNQQVDFVIGNIEYDKIYDHTLRPNAITLTLILEPGQKLSQELMEKIQNKMFDEVKTTLKSSNIPMNNGGWDITKLPQEKWQKIMDNMESFIQGN